MKTNNLGKKGQEEMVGFMIIVVIVALVLLFFLVFSWQSETQGEDSLEAASFLQSALSYTTDCHNGIRYLALDDLIAACYREENCGSSEEYSCDVLNQTLEGILEESWPVGAEERYKGYNFEVRADNSTLIAVSEGNTTNTYKGTRQILPVSSVNIQVSFTAYS